MQLDDALRRGDAVVAAWDLHADEGRRELTVYDVTAGAKPVTTLVYAEGEVAGVSALISARGVRVGHCDGDRPIVWVVTTRGVQAWNEDKLVVDARDGVLRDRLQREHPVASLKAIRGYVQPDYVDRGLIAERTDGTRPTLCYVLSPHAGSDPTYHRSDFLTDSAWIGALGSALAAWAGKPYYGA